MYELQIAKGFAHYHWRDVTTLFQTELLKNIVGQCSEFRISFKHSVTGEEKEYRGDNPLSGLPDTRDTDTLSDWITRWGDRQLHGLDVITDWAKIRKSTYCNAFTSGYDINVGLPHINPKNLGDRLEQYSDVVLSKEGIDFEYFYRNVLTIVNGLIYQPVPQGTYLTIPNAHNVIKEDKDVDVGLWSFENVSEFEYISLGDKFDPDTDINEARQDITFNLGDLIDDEFWYLVVEGKIVTPDSLVHWLDQDRMRLKLGNYDLISGHAEDYRRLGGPDTRATWGGDLKERSGIAKVFQHPNTFIIKFHRKGKLYVDYTALTPSGTKNKFLHMGSVDDPIMRPDNRMVGGYVTHNGDPKVPHVISVMHSETPALWEHTGVDTDNTLLKGIKTPCENPRSESLFLSRVYSLEDKS